MTNELYGALDIGTTTCKFIIVSSEGEVLARTSSEYQVSYPKPGWAEVDPNIWINCAKKCLKAAGTTILSKIVGLSIDAPPHIFVFLDKDGRPLRPSLIWEDQRSIKEAEAIKKEEGDKIQSISKNLIKPIFGLPQLLWVMNNDGETWKKTAKLTFIKDFVRGWLTGDFDYTDPADPIGSLIFDVSKGDWSDYVCYKYGIDRDMLPKIRKATTEGGNISKRIANETMLPEGIPVKVGTIDIAADHLACGAIHVNDMMVKISTVGVLSVVVDEPLKRTVNYTLPIKERWFSKTNTLHAGSSYKWVRNLFSEQSYESMDSLAAQSPEGSNGVIFHPYLGGEASPYWLPQLRGSFYGLTTATTRSDIYRAVLEGVAFSLRDSLSEFNGVSISKGTVVGGGATSDLWCQIIADVLQIELSRVRYTDAAYGSAIIAASSVERLEDTINKWVIIEKRFLPKHTTMYDGFFRKYKRIASFLANNVITDATNISP